MVDYSLRKRPKKSIDKKAVLKDEDLRRRTRLAINFIADVRDLTNDTMAVKMGVKIGTLANYRAMKTSPKYEFVASFCKVFDFNEDWFLKGKGEPFPDARAKYPNYFGLEPTPEPALNHFAAAGKVIAAAPAYIKEGEATWSADGALPAQGFSINEDLILAKSVLESRTHYATALHLNIRSFVAGIAAEAITSRLQENFRAQGELIAQLQARSDERDKQDMKLREEIRELKRTGGDCPPTALTMDHAARTGTDDPAT